MSDERDLLDSAGHDDDAVLPGSGLPGPRRKKQFRSGGEPPAAAPAPAPAVAPAAPRRSSLLPWLLLLLVLGGVAGGYGYQAVIGPALATVSENRDNLALLGSRQQAVLGQQGELIETLKQQAGQDLQWQKIQEDKIARLQARMGRFDRNARGQALLLEVGSLLRQAERLIRLERDLAAAATALRLADQLLQQMNDPGADYVRGILANDVQHVLQAAALDRTALYLQIEGLQSGLDGWATRHSPATQFSPPPPVTAAGVPGWQALLARLQALVVVRPRAPYDQPMLPPEQDWFLRENLRLSLRQAGWAVLQVQPAVYAHAVGQASAWLQRYFDVQDAAVAAALATLRTLAATDVGIPPLDLSATQKALASYRAELGTAESAE